MRWSVLAIVGLLAGLSSASAQAPAPAAASSKPFSRPDLESDAVRVRAAVRKAMSEEAKGQAAGDLFAKGQRDMAGDANAAVDDFGGAIAAGRDDAAVWLALSKAAARAASTLKDDDRRRATLSDWALPAAYLAYRRATSRREEADALDVLGSVYADREIWRPALDALAASLKAVDDPGVRKTYDGALGGLLRA